jgi:hypothetical protein
MGLKPEELRRTTLYDFNLMGTAFTENRKHDFNVMRINAFLISAYSGLEGKERKKLTPEKMFPLEQNNKPKNKDYTKAFALLEAIKKSRGAQC